MANEVLVLDEKKDASAIQFVETIKENMGLTYATNLLVNYIASGIACDSTSKVEPADICSVMTKYKAMNIDPLKSGLYAFKNKGKLVVGISKQGFQQALASQPDYISMAFKHGDLRAYHGMGKNCKDITAYDYVTCVITKMTKSGQIGTIEGTAYFDEEFNEASGSWIKYPKRMLEGRAMCIAIQNAFGYGVYTDDEVREIQTNEVTQPIGKGTAKALSKLNAVAEVLPGNEMNVGDAIKLLESQKTYADFKTAWKSLPKEVTVLDEVMAKGKEISDKLKEVEL